MLAGSRAVVCCRNGTYGDNLWSKALFANKEGRERAGYYMKNISHGPFGAPEEKLATAVQPEWWDSGFARGVPSGKVEEGIVGAEN